MTTTFKPEISVIVTTYNRKELLKETIDSILAQTHVDFELLVIDNFSDYDFLGFIKEFRDDRIVGYQNGNDGVIAVNRNYGIQLAKGDYIALCDDDDLWVPEKLEKQLAIMKADRAIGLCCTNSSYINYKKRPLLQRLVSGIVQQYLYLNLVPAKYTLILVPFVTNSSTLIRFSVLSLIGLLDERPELRTVEDFDLWLRISFISKIYYMDEKLVQYRLHDQQVSSIDSRNLKVRLSKVFSKNLQSLNRFQRLLYKLKLVYN